MLVRLGAQALGSVSKTFRHGSRRTLATLTLFHNPNVPRSVKVLEQLEKARTQPYPKSRKIEYPPLSFDLDILERSPTVDEFSELIYLLNTTTYSDFLNQSMSPSYKAHPTNAQSLYDIVQEDPVIMRWPILINYKTQQIGRDPAEVAHVLKRLVVARDGAPDLDAAVPPRRMARPISTAWVDYD
ncbi:hypothetical protein PILCRDRAFT_812628 [Piloderma croceum F 1598]|uniref:Uncharacterized protein n=1 Tax=Piloderma croceum (strain F 1598) TaxID=765440 RepID=A0A0C3GGT0_PILCF|nr:hypothetical protein PILCRDRAFT_812628 [Piloderma croceum F 1598]